MKVCFLIIPPMSYRIQEAPYSLASTLKENGIQTDIVDFQNEMLYYNNEYDVNFLKMSISTVNTGKWTEQSHLNYILDEYKELIDNLINKIIFGDYDYVALNVWDINKYITVKIVEKIKTLMPNIKMLAGGPNCTIEGDEGRFLTSTGLFHKIFNVRIGEVELLNYLTNNKTENICYKMDDISLISYPENTREVAFSFSRGCGRGCKFCNSGKIPLIQHSKEFGKEQIQKFIKESKPKLLALNDSDCLFNKKLTNTIIGSLVDNPIEWTSFGSVIPDFNKELAINLKKSGCYRLCMGIESFNQKILDAIGKKYTPGHIENQLKTMYNEGVRSVWSIIIGYPGETTKDFVETLKYTIKLKGYYDWITPCCFSARQNVDNEEFNELKSNEKFDYFNWEDENNNFSIREARRFIFQKFSVAKYYDEEHRYISVTSSINKKIFDEEVKNILKLL